MRNKLVAYFLNNTQLLHTTVSSRPATMYNMIKMIALFYSIKSSRKPSRNNTWPHSRHTIQNVYAEEITHDCMRHKAIISQVIMVLHPQRSGLMIQQALHVLDVLDDFFHGFSSGTVNTTRYTLALSVEMAVATSISGNHVPEGLLRFGWGDGQFEWRTTIFLAIINENIDGSQFVPAVFLLFR